MKKTNLLFGAPALALAGILVLLNYGCGKKETPTAPAQAPATNPTSASESKAPAIVSAEKTSFNEVTAQLDPGGNFYLYLGTEQWLNGLSARVGGWRQKFMAMPNLKPEDATNVGKAFDVITGLIKDSGIEDVSGVGLSSIEIEKGIYRNKALLHHYAGKGDGFLWKLGGKEPHPLAGLDLLPANTALAIFSDADLPVLWTTTQKEITAADLPQAQQWLEKFPAQFEKKTGLKWDAVLQSLGGEFGLVVTLDPSNNIPIPLPGGGLQVAAPGLLLAVKVNDDTIFNRIDAALKSNPQVVSVDQSGLKMRTMPVPIPLIGQLRPSAASAGGYLLVASSDDLINEAMAVKAGQKAGLKSTDEFKRLAQGLPDRGNQFAYVSQRFAETMIQIQQQVMAANGKANPEMTQWMQSVFFSRPAFAYSVGANTPEGCLTIGNGSQSYATTALLPGIAMVGVMSAIAIPNFVKARAVSQENACINNLRQIDAAKQQWALENGKTASDVPTADDIKTYLRHNRMPTCPAGGTYTINAVGQPPTCSIPGHKLP